jgi:chemotaxis signal transduction protein
MDAVVFQMGTLRCALELHQVEEVVSLGSVTPVPPLAPGLVGAMNLRGQVVAVLDSRLFLPEAGAATAPVTPPRIGLLARVEEYRVVLCVDRVEGVLPMTELGSPEPRLLEVGPRLRELQQLLQRAARPPRDPRPEPLRGGGEP